ncbi:hypothetical protein MTY414_78040 [Mycolicibacterium mageritense]|nr:hypothetical protein MTY414_78040 [Mycolicibacterium mageritense]
MGRRQKGKHLKRKRSWHHLGNQDRKYARAVRQLDRAIRHQTERIKQNEQHPDR